MNKLFLILSLLIAAVVFQNGCVEEESPSEILEGLENNSVLLSEVEARGNYLNSPEWPAEKNAEEVYNNFSEYIFIDVRSANMFAEGHIQGAVNKTYIELFDYVLSINTNQKKIVIVSSSGQSASYYTALFRLYGISNVYYLNFGMASWHTDFSNVLTEKFNYHADSQTFDNIRTSKPPITSLPEINRSENISNEEFIKQRIINLFNEGFDEITYGNINTVNTVDILYVKEIINMGNPNDSKIICFADANLYFVGSLGCLDCTGHPKGSILYEVKYPVSELSSTKNLQTLPVDKTLLLYCFSGQLSAAGVAYLKLLGYKAKSIIYGAHNMFYSRLLQSEALINKVFQLKNLHDYPYVK